MTKLTAEQQEYRDGLENMLPKGSKVYTLIRSVSSSGMSRRISVFTIIDGELVDLDWKLERAGIAKRRANKDGLYIQGVGMDMCFALTYDIATTLHGDGYSITNSNI